MELTCVDEYFEAAKQVYTRYSNTEFLMAGWNEKEVYKKSLPTIRTKVL